MGRTATETIAASPQIRTKARYYANSDPYARAGLDALVTYAVGAGPMPAHADSEAFLEWWDECDADNRTDFGGIVAQAVRGMATDGESFVQLLQRPEGLRLRLLPAESVDESKSAELAGGGYIAAGIEFNAAGDRVAYWIRPYIPTQQFETYAPPVRVDAADILHLFKPIGAGQVRGVSWLSPVLLKLADLGLLSDALLKGFQVAALHAGFLEDQNGVGGLPFDGEQNGDTLEDVSLEPGVVRRLPPGYKINFNNPQAAQQSVEFMTSQVEAVAAGLGVPAFMVSGNVNRANYSSLRAALITFKASLEALQFGVIVPQLLAPIWKRWTLTRQLRGEGDTAKAAEWRFPALPEADPLKQIQAVKVALETKIMSRAEAIAARGESIERVDSDIAADPHAQTADPENDNQDDEQEPDSNAA
ncbi:phage portal protein [Terricaulis sp.]|uniref:phage portal protein n=1 Tax=Terricaulis sp. TaxID=2768686 RepID=UPI003784F046